uniref:TLDc domain-containing protein n=1 Tax=Romanomermis culicivorax TaxID=13658 RepID=A0A915K3C7_ROMCU
RRHRSQPAAGSPCPFAQRAISLPAQETGAPTLSYYPWTGKNAFIANATRSGLVFGAGEGKFALFLDNDLNRGRTDKCDTFDNSFLTTEQDFLIHRVEAFVFALETPY